MTAGTWNTQIFEKIFEPVRHAGEFEAMPNAFTVVSLFDVTIGPQHRPQIMLCEMHRWDNNLSEFHTVSSFLGQI